MCCLRCALKLLPLEPVICSSYLEELHLVRYQACLLSTQVTWMQWSNCACSSPLLWGLHAKSSYRRLSYFATRTPCLNSKPRIKKGSLLLMTKKSWSTPSECQGILVRLQIDFQRLIMSLKNSNLVACWECEAKRLTLIRSHQKWRGISLEGVHLSSVCRFKRLTRSAKRPLSLLTYAELDHLNLKLPRPSTTLTESRLQVSNLNIKR